jgi:hypothetical protein
MTLILSIHPVAQFGAILLAFYAAYLGFQRTRSLHYNQPTQFLRKRHEITGSIALLSMLGGIGAGLFMVNRYLVNPAMGLHETFAMILLPLGLFGIFSGLFLYLNPGQRRFLPAVHGINNLIILVLAIAQIVTGIMAYLRYVL